MNIGEHSPMFSEPEAHKCFGIIFRGGLQNNGLKHKNTDAVVCLHTCTCKQF